MFDVIYYGRDFSEANFENSYLYILYPKRFHKFVSSNEKQSSTP